jgi:hypothetical protein
VIHMNGLIVAKDKEGFEKLVKKFSVDLEINTDLEEFPSWAKEALVDAGFEVVAWGKTPWIVLKGGAKYQVFPVDFDSPGFSSVGPMIADNLVYFANDYYDGMIIAWDKEDMGDSEFRNPYQYYPQVKYIPLKTIKGTIAYGEYYGILVTGEYGDNKQYETAIHAKLIAETNNAEELWKDPVVRKYAQKLVQDLFGGDIISDEEKKEFYIVAKRECCKIQYREEIRISFEDIVKALLEGINYHQIDY